MQFNEDNDLKFIVGPFFGIINRHDSNLNLTLNEKENSERTLKYYVKDGKVLMLNYITIVTKYYKNKGGMQSNGVNLKIEAAKSVNILHERHPKLTKKYIRKSTGMPELKLKSVKTKTKTKSKSKKSKNSKSKSLFNWF